MDVSTVVHSLLTGLHYNKVYIGNNTQFQKSNDCNSTSEWLCMLSRELHLHLQFWSPQVQFICPSGLNLF